MTRRQHLMGAQAGIVAYCTFALDAQTRRGGFADA